MSVWQRIGGAVDERSVTEGVGRFALLLLPWMAGIILVGIGFGPDLVPTAGQTTAQAILVFFSNSLVYPFLLAGLFAALLTTADSYLIAATQTIVVDWIFTKKLAAAGFDTEHLSPPDQKRMLTLSRSVLIIAGAGAVAFGYLLLNSIPTLLDLLFVIFGLQTALAPVVVWALLGKARPADALAGVISIFAGGAVALACLILGLMHVTLIGIDIGLWAPIFVLSISTFAFGSVRARSRPE
jgi:Na+/proline symporter